MSFSKLPKDVVWLILSDVVVLLLKENYAHENPYMFAFSRSSNWIKYVGNEFHHRYSMSREMARMSCVCKQWQKLLAQNCTFNGNRKTGEFSFKRGCLRNYNNKTILLTSGGVLLINSFM